MNTTPRWLLLTLLGLAACSSADKSSAVPPPGDPCAGVELPPCPPACEESQAGRCGQPCAPGADLACGNNIGDGMQCVDGTWQCSVHAPLSPTGCNLTCK